jgi:hypothetical protein
VKQYEDVKYHVSQEKNICWTEKIKQNKKERRSGFSCNPSFGKCLLIYQFEKKKTISIKNQ